LTAVAVSSPRACVVVDDFAFVVLSVTAGAVVSGGTWCVVRGELLFTVVVVVVEEGVLGDQEEGHGDEFHG
jgi:hypothetical protein